MELGFPTVDVYLRRGFRQIREVVEDLDDTQLNAVPAGAGSNSIAALVSHVCGATEFWLAHIGLGELSERDRDAEFTATATRSELLDLLINSEATSVGAAASFIAGDQAPSAAETHDERQTLRTFMPGGDTSDVAVIIHVLEEMYQHLGHIQVTRDAVLAA